MSLTDALWKCIFYFYINQLSKLTLIGISNLSPKGEGWNNYNLEFFTIYVCNFYSDTFRNHYYLFNA